MTGGVRVLGVSGELDIDTCGELRRHLGSRAGATPDVVDLSECAFIDSTGVGLLVRASRVAREGVSGLVIVAAPGSQVRKTLRLTNVDSAIPVLGSLDAALSMARGNG